MPKTIDEAYFEFRNKTLELVNNSQLPITMVSMFLHELSSIVDAKVVALDAKIQQGKEAKQDGE